MDWILTIAIFLPMFGAIVVLLLGEQQAKRVALGMSLATLLVTVAIASQYFKTVGDDHSGFVLQKKIAWISADAGSFLDLRRLDISYHVGIDAISLWLLVLAAALTPLVILSSFTSIKHRVKEYYAYMLLLQTGMMGVFCALDLILFYIFFEFTLIPLYLLIGIWGGPDKQHAANKFFIYTVAGSVLTFAGILYLGYYCYANGGAMLTFNLIELYDSAAAGVIPKHIQLWLFVALAAGFAIKVPLFPFHTWLPLAHTEAPTAGSVLLAGVLLKLGTYGFLRFSLPLLPEAVVEVAPVMAILAIMGIIYGALVAWVQIDVKKLVAYSSVSHLGFCVLGMFSLKMAGVSGSVLYMINHGLSTGALFLIVGMIYERYHTRNIHEIGGLARQMPWMATFLVFFTLTSIGLPGLNGFVSEFLVLLGTATSNTSYDGFGPGPLGYAYAIPAASGIMLGAVYMLWMCRRVLFGPLLMPPDTPDRSSGLSTDLNKREIAILMPIAACCILIGVYPRALQSSIDPTIRTNILNLRPTLLVEEPPKSIDALTMSEYDDQWAQPEGQP